ncbi:thiamine-phosphate pyrophosphorylase [Pedobacter sp. CG_S7]|uniref:thiamine phosphate synthase n=1 Tax=Pedobacter sp. CG_S7 TaxID=3143930 RepID=UPI003391C88C
MEVIVISNPIAVANEAEIINNLFAAGLKRFHLRKPAYSKLQVIALLTLIQESYHQYIAIHQHHEIAKEFGIARLHYTGQRMKDTNPELWQIQKENGNTLSASIHELGRLSTLNTFDYVFYGPVFNSLSKPGYNSKLPPEFRLVKNPDTPKVIALGGIDAGNLQQVKDKQFDGAAVLGAIWNKPEQALANFKKLNND